MALNQDVTTGELFFQVERQRRLAEVARKGAARGRTAPNVSRVGGARRSPLVFRIARKAVLVFCCTGVVGVLELYSLASSGESSPAQAPIEADEPFAVSVAGVSALSRAPAAEQRGQHVYAWDVATTNSVSGRGPHPGQAQPPPPSRNVEVAAPAQAAEQAGRSASIHAPQGFTSATLRAEPTTASRSLLSLTNGAHVEVLSDAASADGFTWTHVRTADGLAGWVVSPAVS